jgi:fructokinase
MLAGWPFAHVAKVSREELAFLSGVLSLPKGGQSDLTTAAAQLWHEQLRLLVITDGPDGCRYVTANVQGHVPGYRVEAVDTTGAGDGFVAGLLAGLLADESAWERITDFGELSRADLEDTLRLANAVGALTTTQRGAIPALPTRDAVEVLMKGGPVVRD